MKYVQYEVDLMPVCALYGLYQADWINHCKWTIHAEVVLLPV